jgi:hypothetical protein
VGWNLRPRGPLCDLPIAPNLKKALSDALGGCWDNTPPALHPRLLVAALDADSQGLTAVLDELVAYASDSGTSTAQTVRPAITSRRSQRDRYPASDPNSTGALRVIPPPSPA